MENISHFVLNDYQRAILNEMGISSWQLANEEQTQAAAYNQAHEVAATSPEVMPTEDALAKLKQLKVPTQTREATDSVLVVFSPSDTKLQIFTDVLIALDLEAKQQKHITTEQLSQYSNYPLSWAQGEKINLSDKQLTTPTLKELHHPDSKKQLWQQLQSILPVAEN